MWILVIITLQGGTSSTQTSLQSCQQNLIKIETNEIKEAYCMSSNSNDKVYYIKNGKILLVE